MIHIPPDVDHWDVRCGGKKVTLTNLRKIFWPAPRKLALLLKAYLEERKVESVPKTTGCAATCSSPCCGAAALQSGTAGLSLPR
jgi:hypothetical protein